MNHLVRRFAIVTRKEADRLGTLPGHQNDAEAETSIGYVSICTQDTEA